MRAVLEQCRAWQVRLVVFPEYSVPWDILEQVASTAEDMVVVAGSHTVERTARHSGLYERLGMPAPATGQSVCPVLHGGKLLGLQPKLNPAVPERDSMQSGAHWSLLQVPSLAHGPMGVLLCLDFLFRESALHQEYVSPLLDQCHFLVVPSLTPHYTLPEFMAKAWEDARRYGRPVLYSDGASGGGTTLYVDEGAQADLRRFPEYPGVLAKGEEGLIVADVNLGYQRPGRSTRYDSPRAVRPVAAANLLYRARSEEEPYVSWLEELAPLLQRDEDDALDALIDRLEHDRSLLQEARQRPGTEARKERLYGLLSSLDKVTSVEEIRRSLRDVVLPREVLPLEAVQQGLALGAANTLVGWLNLRDAREAGWTETELKLRKAAEGTKTDWHPEAQRALEQLVRAVDRSPEVQGAPPEAERQGEVKFPEGFNPVAPGERKHGGWVFSFKVRPSDFRAGREVTLEGMPGRAGRGGPEAAEDEQRLEPSFTEAQIADAEELYSLAVAEGATHFAALAVHAEGAPHPAALLIACEFPHAWNVWVGSKAGWQESSWQTLEQSPQYCWWTLHAVAAPRRRRCSCSRPRAFVGRHGSWSNAVRHCECSYAVVSSYPALTVLTRWPPALAHPR